MLGSNRRKVLCLGIVRKGAKISKNPDLSKTPGPCYLDIRTGSLKPNERETYAGMVSYSVAPSDWDLNLHRENATEPSAISARGPPCALVLPSYTALYERCAAYHLDTHSSIHPGVTFILRRTGYLKNRNRNCWTGAYNYS